MKKTEIVAHFPQYLQTIESEGTSQQYQRSMKRMLMLLPDEIDAGVILQYFDELSPNAQRMFRAMWRGFLTFYRWHVGKMPEDLGIPTARKLKDAEIRKRAPHPAATAFAVMFEHFHGAPPKALVELIWADKPHFDLVAGSSYRKDAYDTFQQALADLARWGHPGCAVPPPHSFIFPEEPGSDYCMTAEAFLDAVDSAGVPRRMLIKPGYFLNVTVLENGHTEMGRTEDGLWIRTTTFANETRTNTLGAATKRFSERHDKKARGRNINDVLQGSARHQQAFVEAAIENPSGRPKDDQTNDILASFDLTGAQVTPDFNLTLPGEVLLPGQRK